MVFSSYYFIFYFLPLALAVYFLTPSRGKNLSLVICSYFFYAWSGPAFVLLLLFSTLVDYVCSLVIVRGQPGGRLEAGTPRTPAQKVALAVSVLTNLLVLGVFKYGGFMAQAVQTASSGDVLLSGPVMQLVLPAGLSFYTLQSMSYTIDVYRGVIAVTRSPVRFACYVAMFPQLVAGPIVRFATVESALNRRDHSLEKFGSGVLFFSLGIAKKILLANPCGQVADACFAASSLSPVDAWGGVLAYGAQIYFDFSGYTDMAIGLGLMLGFSLPANFASPYRATSLRDFWRRWHITLSTWLRDYLYIPLGGNRKGPVRRVINLMIVMTIGGLWHGAAWGFVLWGAIHGLLLVLEYLGQQWGWTRKLPKPLCWAVTFLLVHCLWVFFRAESIGEAGNYLATMFGASSTGPRAELMSAALWNTPSLLTLALAWVVIGCAPRTDQWVDSITLPKALCVVVLLVLSLFAMVNQQLQPFIYFVF